MDRKDFYKKKVENHIINKDSSILVLGAGNLDKEIFETLNFSNVKLSNINNNDTTVLLMRVYIIHLNLIMQF
jgi:hypothetical protein